MVLWRQMEAWAKKIRTRTWKSLFLFQLCVCVSVCLSACTSVCVSVCLCVCDISSVFGSPTFMVLDRWRLKSHLVKSVSFERRRRRRRLQWNKTVKEIFWRMIKIDQIDFSFGALLGDLFEWTTLVGRRPKPSDIFDSKPILVFFPNHISIKSKKIFGINLSVMRSSSELKHRWLVWHQQDYGAFSFSFLGTFFIFQELDQTCPASSTSIRALTWSQLDASWTKRSSSPHFMKLGSTFHLLRFNLKI